MSFFKAYDMRGVFGQDFTFDTVWRVGRWLPSLLGARRFLIGRDARLTSPEMRDALCRGLLEAGADVDDMGLATTSMVYFFTTKKNYDASVMITASHNPPDNNGMKVSIAGSLPVGQDTGLRELERRVRSLKLLEPAPCRGTLREVNYLGEYIKWLASRKLSFSGLRFAVDCSNGMAGLLAKQLFGKSAVYLNDVPDGHFPAHSPNPLLAESRAQLSATVREKKLDLGLIFDGDADRVMFVDENGEFVQPDYLIPVIARHFLKTEPGSAVICDIRTSRGVLETLESDGAKPVLGKVGHAFAKLLLRKTGAVCGGELAGHYYFRDFCHCDSGEFAALVVLEAASKAKKQGVPFSKMLAPIMRYANSGECNFEIAEKAKATLAIRNAMSRTFGTPRKVLDFDGIRMEYGAGWVNVRQSNTEPYLRIIAEAFDKTVLSRWMECIEEALKPFRSDV